MMGTGDWERTRNDHGIWAGHIEDDWNHKMREEERRGGWFRKNSNGNISSFLAGSLVGFLISEGLAREREGSVFKNWVEGLTS